VGGGQVRGGGLHVGLLDRADSAATRNHSVAG
jgi:hypothetical protein